MTPPPDQSSPLTDEFQAMGRKALIERARKEKWFHNMRLPGIDTGSWVYENHLPQNYHLFPVFQFLNELRLDGMVCLDIGTFDGMGAFSLAARGAARVDATCQEDLDRFRIARALLGFGNVAYYPKTDLEAIHAWFAPAQYDLVLMTAMLHHLLSPLDGLLEARRLLRKGGVLILEAVVRHGDTAVVWLNTGLEDPVYGCPTIWICSPDAVMAMLRLAGFNPLSEIRLVGGERARETNYNRITILAEAVGRKEIQGGTGKLGEFHEKIDRIGRFSFAEFEAADSPKSAIAQSFGGLDRRSLDIWTHHPEDPLQPRHTLLTSKT